MLDSFVTHENSDKCITNYSLNVRVTKKYPYVPPVIDFTDVKGLNNNDLTKLKDQLLTRCKELCEIGSPVVCELVQVTEDFLYSHNTDPKISAYDQMLSREKEQKKLQQEEDQKFQSFVMNVSDENSMSKNRLHSENSLGRIDEHAYIENDRIQRELDRQHAALTRAYDDDNGDEESIQNDDFDYSFDEDDEDEDLDALEFDEPKAQSNSRYDNDFIEVRELGRGGGGMVFEVKNRLDRRKYAVKKIFLQSERGKMKEFGKKENMKLRREVTTISRMTHRNIVRYYQAWVEGREEELSDGEDDDQGISTINEKSVESESDDSSSSSDDENGFFSKKPTSNSNLQAYDDFSWSSEEDSDSSESDGENDTGRESSTPAKGNIGNFDSDDESLLPNTPNLGFENHFYSDLLLTEKPRKNSTVSGSSEEDYSSIMEHLSSDVRKGSKSILYIQMEYCSTTLRQLIDERKIEKLEKNDCWRMIRQTLEALVYIHKKKIIHRDLKPGMFKHQKYFFYFYGTHLTLLFKITNYMIF